MWTAPNPFPCLGPNQGCWCATFYTSPRSPALHVRLSSRFQSLFCSLFFVEVPGLTFQYISPIAYNFLYWWQIKFFPSGFNALSLISRPLDALFPSHCVVRYSFMKSYYTSIYFSYVFSTSKRLTFRNYQHACPCLNNIHNEIKKSSISFHIALWMLLTNSSFASTKTCSRGWCTPFYY